MIKRIIFDIDNTLIIFPKIFSVKYDEIILKYNLNINAKEFYDIIGEYEISGKYKKYTKKDMNEFINSKLNMNLPESFVDDFIEKYNELPCEIFPELVETLDYLYDKYELIALSNWFTSSQKIRLEKAGILKYFDKVYGADIVDMKPNPESFVKVIDNLKPQQCLMVGDNYEMDIKTPLKIGMNAILINGKKENYNCKSIDQISDLRNIL